MNKQNENLLDDMNSRDDRGSYSERHDCYFNQKVDNHSPIQDRIWANSEARFEAMSEMLDEVHFMLWEICKKNGILNGNKLHRQHEISRGNKKT